MKFLFKRVQKFGSEKSFVNIPIYCPKIPDISLEYQASDKRFPCNVIEYCKYTEPNGQGTEIDSGH